MEDEAVIADREVAGSETTMGLAQCRSKPERKSAQQSPETDRVADQSVSAHMKNLGEVLEESFKPGGETRRPLRHGGHGRSEPDLLIEGHVDPERVPVEGMVPPKVRARCRRRDR
jgi:hypothetical protein